MFKSQGNEFLSMQKHQDYDFFFQERKKFTSPANPYLTYNIIVWGSTNPSHLNPLIILQKRIVRILAGSEYLAHSTPLFLKLSILKLLDLHKYFVCMYMFDERNREDFSINHNLNTRNRNNLQPKFHRLSKTQHALSYVGPKIWNDLPCNIKSVRSLPIFKRKLRNYLLSSYGELQFRAGFEATCCPVIEKLHFSMTGRRVISEHARD